MMGDDTLDRLLTDAEWLREMHAFGQHWWLSPMHQRIGLCPICLLARPTADAPKLWRRPTRTGRHRDYRAVGLFRAGR